MAGTVVHKWEKCETYIPFLLAPPDTICYVVKADYSGEGLVPDQNLCIIIDGYEQGTLKPAEKVSDCDKVSLLCNRYQHDDRRCAACFSSAGSGCKQKAFCGSDKKVSSTISDKYEGDDEL
jgi:hypothetical protein